MTAVATPLESAVINYAQISHSLAEKGYIVIPGGTPGGLELGLVDAVQRYLCSLAQNDFSNAGIGHQTNFQRNRFVRSDEIAWTEGNERELQGYFDWVSGLQQCLNRELYLGVHEFECHFAHYAPGDFYKTHLDAFRDENKRKVTVILYLNREWQSVWGGELLLYAPQSDSMLERVSPEYGTMVIFLSEEFPHEVLPASHDRYSLTGWLRRT